MPALGAAGETPRFFSRTKQRLGLVDAFLLLRLRLLFLLGGLGTLPTWPHSRNWGYGPSGGLGLIVLILVVLVLLYRF